MTSLIYLSTKVLTCKEQSEPMFSFSDGQEKYHEILMQDLSRVTPFSSDEVQSRIHEFAIVQPKNIKIKLTVNPYEDDPSIQVFRLTKSVQIGRFEELPVVIQGYFYKQDSGKRTKIVASAKIAIGYWFTHLVFSVPILIAGYLILIHASSDIVIRIIGLFMIVLFPTELFVRPYLS